MSHAWGSGAQPVGTASLASAPPRLRASAPLPLQLLPRPPGLCISKGSGGKRLDVRQDPRVLRGVTCLTCGPPSGPVPVWVPLVFQWDSAVSQEQAESWPRFRRFESPRLASLSRRGVQQGSMGRCVPAGRQDDLRGHRCVLSGEIPGGRRVREGTKPGILFKVGQGCRKRSWEGVSAFRCG